MPDGRAQEKSGMLRRWQWAASIRTPTSCREKNSTAGFLGPGSQMPKTGLGLLYALK